MRQLTLTLTPEIDEKALLKVLKNLNGVRNIEVSDEKENRIATKMKRDNFLKDLKEIRDSIDTSLIDFEDEKTKYILSK